jgi:prepilin-type N-terminal cleavage/methylation domain-containing protein
MQTVNKNSQGLTLIEVLIGIVILGMLGLGVLSLQYLLGQNQTLVYKNYINVDEASSAVAQFSKEIRIMRSSDSGVYALDTVGDFEIIFYSDVDFDEETEKIRYFLDGTSFSKGTIEPVGYPVAYPQEAEKVKVLTTNARNLSEPTFYYYNSDWPSDTENNPLASSERLNQTRTIKIYLRVNTTADEAEKDFVLESYIQPRMLKDNL